LKAGLAEPASKAEDEATIASDGGRSEHAFDGAVTESGISQPYAGPTAGTLVRYFGDYELLEEIARGGMGVVFRARQTRLNRIVALKMILTGRLATEADVRRFQTEAEAAAQLDHPGIVPVFEVGQHQGHHFYSMALVNGESLADRISRGPIEARVASRLLREVALAVHYAHEKGVIHRDLKPANILIDETEKPRVTDFGLAKQITDGDSATVSGQILGTPSYMAPEQALAQSDAISKLTDVYALGATLYAALCGHPPHQADNPLDTLRLIVDSDPVPPRQWNPGLPKDLETICLACLKRNPAQRYASAKMMAEELARFEEGKPILARPVGRSARLWRWCLRNRGLAALSVTSILLLVAGALTASGLAIHSGRQRDFAEHQLERANSELYRNQISLADSEMKFGNTDSVQRILANCVAQGRPPEGLGWEWKYLARSTLLSPSQFVREQTLPVVGVDVSRSGNRLVRLTQNGSVDVFDPKSLRLLNHFDVGEEVEPGISISEDGTRALLNTRTRSLLIRLSDGHEVWSSEAERASVLGLDGKTVFGQFGFELRSWDTETGQLHWSTPLPFSGSNRRDMQADADRVFVLDELLLRVFDQSTGELNKELAVADVLLPDGRQRPFHSVHPESGKIILLENSPAQRIFVADIENRRPAVEAGGVFRGLALAPSGIGSPQFSHDGSLLAYAIDRVDFLENSDAAASRAESEFLDSSELLAEWRIDGSKRFAWPSTNRVRIVDMKTGKLLRTLKGFSGSKLNGLTFTPDGTRLIAWGGHVPKAFWPVPDQPFSEMRVWHVSQPGTVILQGHSEAIRQVAFTPDSQHILSSAEDGTVCVWDTNSGQLLRVFDRHQYDAETGKRLQIWERRLDRQRHLRHGSRLERAVQVSLLGQSDQAVSSLGSRLLVWKIETGEVVHEFEAAGKLRSRLAMNPQGTQVAYATGTGAGQVTIHQLPSGEVTAEWETKSAVDDLAWSPDGTQIATVVGGESLAELNIIETDTQECVLRIDFREGNYLPFWGDGFRPSSICYLPNKPHVVVGGANGISMVIDAETGQLLKELSGHTSAVLAIAVSPDGSRIATASFDSTVRLWSANSGQLMHTFRDYSKPVNSIAFSNDGKNLVAGGDDGKVLVWKAGL
jgi:serine/threonine protein kinase/WD40 repeat protein